MTPTTDEQRDRIRRQVASGRAAIARAQEEQQRIQEALERSRGAGTGPSRRSAGSATCADGTFPL